MCSDVKLHRFITCRVQTRKSARTRGLEIDEAVLHGDPHQLERLHKAVGRRDNGRSKLRRVGDKDSSRRQVTFAQQPAELVDGAAAADAANAANELAVHTADAANGTAVHTAQQTEAAAAAAGAANGPGVDVAEQETAAAERHMLDVVATAAVGAVAAARSGAASISNGNNVDMQDTGAHVARDAVEQNGVHDDVGAPGSQQYKDTQLWLDDRLRTGQQGGAETRRSVPGRHCWMQVDGPCMRRSREC